MSVRLPAARLWLGWMLLSSPWIAWGAESPGAGQVADRPLAGERLSAWLQRHTPPGDHYALALSVQLTAARPAQESLHRRLLTSLTLGDLPQITEVQRDGMLALLRHLPVTGRVPLVQQDPRWLEVHPDADPVLDRDSEVRFAAQPDWVAVLDEAGVVHRVQHHPGARAIDYLRAVSARAAEVDRTWIVQPDGRVRSFNIAAWNAEPQDEPAPGAVLWAPPRGSGWPVAFSEALLQVLSSVSVADWQALPVAAPQSTAPITAELAAPTPGWFEFGPGPRPHPISSNDFGVPGLLQTSSARFAEAGHLRVDISHVLPYTRLNVMIQPLDGMEVGFRYSDINGVLYGPTSLSGSQTYKDKSVDLRMRLMHESAVAPDLALVFTDIAGTGLFSGQSLVASKRIDDADFSFGLAWGYAGERGSLPNPLGLLFPAFKQEVSSSATSSITSTGSFNVHSYFRGRTAPFGGVELQTPIDALSVKLEYDGNAYTREPFGQYVPAVSPINAGVVYQLRPGLALHAGLERGNTLELALSIDDDLGRFNVPKTLSPPMPRVAPEAPLTAPDWNRTAQDLEAQTLWSVTRIEADGDVVRVTLGDIDGTFWLGRIDRAVAVLHRDAPAEVRRFQLVFEQRGVTMTERDIDRATWVNHHIRYALPGETDDGIDAVAPRRHGLGQLLYDGRQGDVRYALGPGFQQTIGGPNGFILYQISAQGAAQWSPAPQTYIDGTVNARVIDNYSLFTYDAPSGLPRVRTYLREYLTTARVTLPNLQLTHFSDLGDGRYAEVYGGLLESMFAGAGGEYLYRPWNQPFAIGVDVNHVKQRDFRQDFALRDYSVNTGHVTLYWDTGWNNTHLTLAGGQYLAGDRGFTLVAARLLDDGVTLGAYATRTNVNSAQFGEGSFDKGMFLNIPFDAALPTFSPNLWAINWTPLTRDGGAFLQRSHGLYDLTASRDPHYLKFGPSDANDLSDSEHALGPEHDQPAWLRFGDVGTVLHEAQVGEVLPKLLQGAGWVLGASVLDSRIDRLMQRHASSTDNKLGKLASDVPYALAVVDALLWSGASGDRRLADTAWTGIEAATVSTGIALATKYLVGRARPSADLGTHNFQPFGQGAGNSGFPSEQTTAAFALITPMAEDTGATWLYPLAGLTAIGRMQQRQHFLSDTVAGGLLGHELATAVYDVSQRRQGGPRIWVGADRSVNASWDLP